MYNKVLYATKMKSENKYVATLGDLVLRCCSLGNSCTHVLTPLVRIRMKDRAAWVSLYSQYQRMRGA